MKYLQTAMALALFLSAAAEGSTLEEAGLQALLDNGSPQAVVEQMEAQLDDDAESAEVHYWLARGQLAQIEDAWVVRKMRLALSAKEHLETALALDETHVPTRRALGQYYLEAPAIAGGSLDDATAQAEALLKLDEATAYKLKAEIAQAQDDKSGSIAYGRKALAAGTWDWDTQYALVASAVFYELTDAVSVLDEAEVNVRAQGADATRQLMLVDYQRGKLAALTGQALEPGMASLNRYLNFIPGPDDPGLDWARFRLAQVERQLGLNAEARARLAALESTDVSEDLGFALQDERRWHYAD